MMTITATAEYNAPIDTVEASLLDRLRRGDGAAFEEMVRHYGAKMLAVARRLLRNEDDARDVVQEAFLHAFRSLEAFRADAKLSTWLHRIVVNSALMRLRSASRRPEGFLDDLLPNFDETGHHTDALMPLPLAAETAIEQSEVRARVRGAIEQLPEAYRAIIVLRDLEELSTAETATLLGISENATKIRLHRARQALAAMLRDSFAEAA